MDAAAGGTATEIPYRRGAVANESINPDELSTETTEKVDIPKTAEQRCIINENVKKIIFFRSLEEPQLRDVVNAMSERLVKPGEYVIRQGEDGDNFYVITSGKYTALVKKSEDSDEEKEVKRYDSTGSFGELALMYNQPRAASVRADTEGVLWALDRASFRRIVLLSTFQKRKTYETFINSVPLLKELALHERTNVADALYPRVCTPGEVIIRQGDANADAMNFIEDGEVIITAKDPSTGAERQLKVCQRGDYFGELALIHNAARAATATAGAKGARLAVLDVAAFERLLGPCVQMMRRNESEMQRQLAELFESKVSLEDLRGGSSAPVSSEQGEEQGDEQGSN